MNQRISVFAALLACLVFCLAQPLAAETLRGKTKSGDFKDLPGVWRPRQDDGRDRTSCTSSIERQRWRPDSNGLAQRVYRCDTETFTWQSNREPNEIEWRKHQLRNKPWVTDGF